MIRVDPCKSVARRDSGLTLVELMIAIALMLVMTLQLQIVFGQSRQLYLAADALAQVYQNARGALDQIEKDLSNAVLTDQMDFFNDNRTAAIGVGHFGRGEENGIMRGNFLPAVPYVYSMAFRQPKEYMPSTRGVNPEKLGGPYRMDSMYFRTFTMVQGRPREAMVQYRLDAGLDPYSNPRPRPVLQRLVTSVKVNPTTGVPIYTADGYPELERQPAQDMCYYVQEVKIDLFIRDQRRNGIGRFYSPKEAIVQAPTPQDPFPPRLVNLLGGGDDVAIQCLDGRLEPEPTARLRRDDAKLYLRNGDSVPHLGPGSKMYLRMKQYPPNFEWDFNGSYVTIKEVVRVSAGETVVSFEEEAEIKQAFPSGASVPPEVEMMYRGGWLPQAVRVQLKIKDQRNEEVRTMSRIFQILRS